jgi:hypothetical protein
MLQSTYGLSGENFKLGSLKSYAIEIEATSVDAEGQRTDGAARAKARKSVALRALRRKCIAGGWGKGSESFTLIYSYIGLAGSKSPAENLT